MVVVVVDGTVRRAEAETEVFWMENAFAFSRRRSEDSKPAVIVVNFIWKF